MKLCLGPILVSILGCISVFAIGCTTSSEPVSAEDEPAESTEDELAVSCTYPRRYAAILIEGECTTLRARRGQWVPSPAFADAPDESGACVYSWVADKKGVHVDREAIKNWVGDRGVLTAMCGSDNGLDPAHVQQIPQLSTYGMAGSVGCDVCGLLKNNKIWIVIPPERETHREFQVPLTNGTLRSFSINANESASVMSIALPPLPPGVQYVNGRVAIQ
jgi:hypothetical protein